jgi:hemoglobin-like flavoprotein
MALDVTTLRHTFALVIERNPDVTTRFYEVLFEKYPQVKPLFSPSGQKRQEAMLAQALVSVLEHLEDAPWLTETLTALGAKHKDYGVTREMYDWVGDALLLTLAETAAAQWTPAVAQAWADAYGAIASLMLTEG